MLVHPIEPVYDQDSEIIILGSFPSVKSRETGFYYGNPNNRFWKVLAKLYSEQVPQTIAEKKEFLLRNHIAVWDVIHSCEINGSSDSSISNVTVNDIKGLVDKTKIKTVFTNGQKAFELYEKYLRNTVGLEAQHLPSTSPANAGYSFEELCESWKQIKR